MRRYILLAPLLLVLPFAAGAQTTLNSIITALTRSLSGVIALGLGVALIVFLWGMVKFIMKAGDDKEIVSGRKQMFWGIVGLFMIVSIWGVVQLLRVLTGVPENTSCSSPVIDMSDTMQIRTNCN